MSINHFSTDLQEPQWWGNPNSTSTQTHQQNHPAAPQFYQNHPAWLHSQEPTTLNFNLNHMNHDAAAVENSEFHDRLQHLNHQSPPPTEEDEEKEHMFEKPLTPSDVGKLNRLVIPKQHAEKYFPLGGGDSGLLLTFEDESGKSWRFRYSYWNSSQSYVLTKGWSRYVKEKQLDAGDVVLFERRRAHTDRLYIGWRRRSAVVPAHDSGNTGAQVSGAGESSSGNRSGGGGGWTRMFYSAPQQQYSSYPAHHQLYHHHQSVQSPYPPDCLHAAAGSPGQNLNQTTSVGSSKILRLFGVNLECGHQQPGGADESEPSTPDGSSSLSMSSGHGPNHHHQQLLFPRAYNYADHSEDFSLSRDVNLMRNRRG